MAPRPPTAEAVASLLEAAGRSWAEFVRRRPGYHTYLPADWAGVVPVLSHLRGEADTFLEWGSGLGVVAILADLLGFDAYGIELDPWLHGRSVELAERARSRALLVQGSFVPAECRDDDSGDETGFCSIRDGTPAYRELGMPLDAFDLVYAFPWPGEEEGLLRIMQTCARRDAQLLLYRGVEGFQLFRHGRRTRLRA